MPRRGLFQLLLLLGGMVFPGIRGETAPRHRAPEQSAAAGATGLRGAGETQGDRGDHRPLQLRSQC